MKRKALLILLSFALVVAGGTMVYGQGAQFFDIFFDVIFIPDDDGDFCQSTLIPPDFGNSFVRANPNGRVTVYYSGHPASVVFVTAAGDVYTGIGQATANGCVAGCNWATFHITGKVSNGSETKRAVCTGAFNAKGRLVRLDASLR